MTETTAHQPLAGAVRRCAGAAQAVLDPRAHSLGQCRAEPEGQAAREPPGDRVRGSQLPEHPRMLRPRHGHLHDSRRGLHPPLLVLRRGPRPPQAAGCQRAGQPGPDRGRHGPEVRGGDQCRSR
ncbi:hypothetical protein G6F35_007140 [Rhizopus arrhizus]|nr:hypothetical protein G6F35_007140 [Rhizopus arrhizus]